MNQTPGRILIVDDYIENIQVVGNYLSQENYDVSFAQSGEEAVEAATAQDLDLILLDVMMPGMNGFDAARIIKKLPGKGDIPIIFLTALSEKESILQGFEAGAVDYITKPFQRNELLARVRTHVSLQKAKTSLQESNQALQSANLARDRFFSILAHDLKNPFNGLISLMDEILRNFDSFEKSDLKTVMSSLHNSSSKVYQLLLTLLDWGKSQTGGLVLTFQDVMLYKVFDAIEGAVESQLEKKKISLKTDFETPSVWADLETFATVLRNLVSNAIKFTPEGGTITVISRAEESCTRVEVRDTGVGIKPEIISKLFKIDEKVITLGTQKETGTGLGLILCLDYVKKNGGTLEVQSEVGKGSSFICRFPLKNKSLTVNPS